TQYGLPIEHSAKVHADLEYPDGSHGLVAFAESEPGVFTAALTAQQAGLYRFRVIAEGVTMRAQTFTREELAVGAVWAGGDTPPPRPGNGDAGNTCCNLLDCLLGQRVLSRELEERLRHAGVNLDAVRHCVKTHCRHGSKT